MDTKKLESWANKLLDTGKRNNLINFKDTKNGTVEIIIPNPEVLFSKVESKTSFELFDPKIIEDDDLEFQEENDNDESIENADKKERYIKDYSSKIKKHNMILGYNEWSNVISVIKKIDKKSKTIIEETGVNVLYLAFGFVCWKESENAQSVYRAPIILAPVSFKNESAISPYYMQMSDDDLVVNPTFSYMINAQYGISLPEFEEESLSEYLNKVETLVKKLGWTVENECKIGIFSFLKLNMYEDIMSNMERILQNNNVRVLLGEQEIESSIDGVAESEIKKIENELIDIHNIVDADSSQLDAIQLAKQGKSFVLQGPPGTGKSQTISNIIAECLSDNKKVLFVSEKQAALNVVYDKLNKAGLGEFCLELHSHKANKKNVIDELCHTLKAPRSILSSRAESEIDEKIKAQKNLDEYARELHLKREVINKSLYQLYEAYSGYREEIDIDFVIKDINKKDENYLKRVKSLLEQYEEYVDTIGYNFKENPWYGFTQNDINYQLMLKLKTDFEVVSSTLKSMIPFVNYLRGTLCVASSNIKQIIAWINILDVLGNSDFITPSFLEDHSINNRITHALSISELGKEIVSVKEELLSSYDEEILSLDAKYNKLLTRQYNSVLSRTFSSDYKQIIKEIRLNRKDGKKISYDEAVYITQLVSYYQQKCLEFEVEEKNEKSYLGPAFQGVNTDWDYMITQIKYIEEQQKQGIKFGKISRMSLEEYFAEKNTFLKNSADNKKKYEIMTKALSDIQEYFDKNILNVTEGDFKAVLVKIISCQSALDRLENWCSFVKVYDSLVKEDLSAFIDIIVSSNIKKERITKTYCKAFYLQWIDYIIHESNSFVSNLDRIAHDKMVEVFKQKDEINLEINKAQIKSFLSKKRPSTDMISQGSSLAILLREGEKKRKQKSIRILFEEIGDLAQTLKPCFLMSPLSVSTFLQSSLIKFDTVVFDEASQIFPQDAIGAVYRGKQLIVVGDSKQMPPTNFFTATLESESDDEETGDVNDYESLLDICSATMQQIRLRWHYRSRFEQLITFSNRNFYEGDLVTFPSAKTDNKGIGIDYYYVNGTVEHKRVVNRKEAEAVVELVYENAKSYPNRSLGVVAFNIAQQDLIEKLLYKRRQEQPLYEEFFSTDRDEPFFIKNLETVQGDERDTIIFSTTYGKDSMGRFVQNFGPLNRIGGERRLNVAVTRAKINVQLVTSMKHTDINITENSSNGKRLLKEYLDFAENGCIALDRAVNVSEFDEYDSEFELEVHDYLKSLGYTVDTQVGVSNFKIDLGLRRSDSSDYVLAIECDGATYHSSRNARDRDRLRQEILERMGWKFYRIWSTDWFRNNSVEKERLVAAVEAALNEETVKDNSSETNQHDVSFEEKIQVRHLVFPKYKMVSERQLMALYDDKMKVIDGIAKVEAPISEEWLLKRIVSMFGRTKLTNVVWDEYENLMRREAHLYGLARRKGFIYIADNKQYSFRVPESESLKRDVKHVAVEELAVGMLVVIEQNIMVEKTGLFSTISKALGFHKVGPGISERMEEALSLIGGLVEVDGENVSLKQKFRK